MGLVIKGPENSAKSTVYWLIILLGFTIGYCDATTLCVSGFLSGHVFFNIAILGYQFMQKTGSYEWLPLFVIPIFISCFFSSLWLLKKGMTKMMLYRIAGILLLSSGIISVLFTANGIVSSSWSCIAAALIVVIVMGMLNAGRTRRERKNWLSYGLSTIISPIILNRNQKIVSGTLLFATFILGCLTGIMAANLLGLSGAILPGVLLILLTTG